MDQPSDAEVVAHVLAGEREQYRLLVHRYQEMLYRHALGMTAEPDVAADLVQDSFIKAYLSLDQCQDKARFGAWVFRILRNRCHDYLKDIRRRSVPLESAALLSERETPETDLEHAEMRGAIERALAHLPEAQREAFLLKHVQGCSYEEMAELLQTSVSALKMRVMRARESLQENLQEAGYSRG